MRYTLPQQHKLLWNYSWANKYDWKERSFYNESLRCTMRMFVPIIPEMVHYALLAKSNYSPKAYYEILDELVATHSHRWYANWEFIVSMIWEQRFSIMKHHSKALLRWMSDCKNEIIEIVGSNDYASFICNPS